LSNLPKRLEQDSNLWRISPRRFSKPVH